MASLPIIHVMRSAEASLFPCTGNFHKSGFKQKTLYRAERISCDNRQVLVGWDVKTSEKVASYRFRTEFGGELKVIVKKKNSRYGVNVELGSCWGQGELWMMWESSETRFVGDAVELEFEENLAPFHVSFLLKTESGSTIRSHRSTNFTVPAGFGAGHPSPLGVSFSEGGSVNFAFFSRDAKNVVLCLYADKTAEKPALEIDLDPYINRTGDVWHALLYTCMPFVSYGYRCRNKEEDRVLLDPYAKVIEPFGLIQPKIWLGKLCEEPTFDWSGEVPPNLPMEKMIVYRLNVSRFTEDGSFCAISEKLHHFKDLGVNAIMLEPVFPFDEQNGPYFPWHFFSPGSLYGDPSSMKEMVKTLHAGGIEVLIEVVFTHIGEVGALKEIDTSYCNMNALNCNHPVVQQLVLECLHYWVTEFHVDGFCFINASCLTRGSRGEFLSRPPLVEAIALDPLLSKVKLIADSWDPHDMETNEVKFPHWQRWAEMNSKYSMNVKNFVRGDGLISKLATRLCGSGDLFWWGRGPAFSFNYITRNTGLTLVDLVSFTNTSELSWNCGEEGATNKAVVLETRLKQIRNFLFILFISLGVPVLNMGDECGLSTGGSPAYGDRKPLDWKALRSGFGIQMTQFISFLSSLKMRRSDLLQKRGFLNEDSIEWHGRQQSPPRWDDPACKFLAMTLDVDADLSQSNKHGNLFVAFNAGDQSEEVVLPPLAGDMTWVLLVDTSLPFPAFFSVDGVPHEETYEMKSHSCMLFEARSLS